MIYVVNMKEIHAVFCRYINPNPAPTCYLTTVLCGAGILMEYKIYVSKCNNARKEKQETQENKNK